MKLPYQMSTDTKILVVEDDVDLSAMISDFLTPNGFIVSVEGNGATAVQRILDENPEVVILDVNLPGKNGFDVCREVRGLFGGTIMILTARGEEIDEVVGLEIGADDFLSKPVRPRALLARIRTHLRRVQTEPNREGNSVIQVEGLSVDASRRVCLLNENEIELTTAEFDLLWLLAENAGNILSRNDLYFKLNGFKYDGLDRSIDLRVSRLRKKLNDDSSHPQLIKSVRGVGYMLALGKQDQE